MFRALMHSIIVSAQEAQEAYAKGERIDIENLSSQTLDELLSDIEADCAKARELAMKASALGPHEVQSLVRTETARRARKAGAR